MNAVNYRGLALAILLAMPLVSACDNSEPAPPPPLVPPNVLLITLDTVRPDFLGAYGATSGASPHLDSLAAEGVVFERAIAASPRTVPSHASIMTSLFVRDHSVGWVNGSTRLDGEPTLAEQFVDAGYETAAIVGNMQLRHLVGLDAGFDRYDDDMDSREANRPQFRERRADGTTRRALDWLERRGDAPWFLWLHYQDAHGPYTPPAEHLEAVDLVDPAEAPLPLLKQNRGEGGVPAYQAVPGDQRPSAYADRYAAEIHFLDDGIGQVLEEVDQLAGDTVILVTADHGESIGEEGWWFSHGFRTTPDQIHVPFILRAPGVSPGRRSELVHHVDVAPTLLELAGLDALPQAKGLDVSKGSRGLERAGWLFADVGFETSAYRDDVFVRVTDSEPTKGNEEIETSTWSRWKSTGEWTEIEALVDSAEEAEAHPVSAYRASTPEMAEVAVPSPAEYRERLRQLRALGYVEEGEDEERPDSAGASRGTTKR